MISICNYDVWKFKIGGKFTRFGLFSLRFMVQISLIGAFLCLTFEVEINYYDFFKFLLIYLNVKGRGSFLRQNGFFFWNDL